MVEILCHCNHGIKGVKELPPHMHPASPDDYYKNDGAIIMKGPFAGTRTPRLHRDPDQDPKIFINWKKVARSLFVVSSTR